MKKFILIISIIVLLITLVFLYKRPDDFKSISEYVNENHEELEKVAKEYVKGNKKYYSKKFTSISVYSKDDVYLPTNNTIVQFMVKGYGLAPSSTYVGFYYSESDIPAAFQNENYQLSKKGENKWEWTGTGDNHGTTIKLRNNWYYFEASF